MDRVLYTIGAFPEQQVPYVTDALYKNQKYEDEIHRLRLFAVSKWENSLLSDAVAQLTWEEILTFVYERLKKYRNVKAQHSQWDGIGKRLFRKMERHRYADDFVADVMKEMGL